MNYNTINNMNAPGQGFVGQSSQPQQFATPSVASANPNLGQTNQTAGYTPNTGYYQPLMGSQPEYGQSAYPQNKQNYNANPNSGQATNMGYSQAQMGLPSGYGQAAWPPNAGNYNVPVNYGMNYNIPVNYGTNYNNAMNYGNGVPYNNAMNYNNGPVYQNVTNYQTGMNGQNNTGSLGTWAPQASVSQFVQTPLRAPSFQHGPVQPQPQFVQSVWDIPVPATAQKRKAADSFEQEPLHKRQAVTSNAFSSVPIVDHANHNAPPMSSPDFYALPSVPEPIPQFEGASTPAPIIADTSSSSESPIFVEDSTPEVISVPDGDNSQTVVKTPPSTAPSATPPASQEAVKKSEEKPAKKSTKKDANKGKKAASQPGETEVGTWVDKEGEDFAEYAARRIAWVMTKHKCPYGLVKDFMFPHKDSLYSAPRENAELGYTGDMTDWLEILKHRLRAFKEYENIEDKRIGRVPGELPMSKEDRRLAKKQRRIDAKKEEGRQAAATWRAEVERKATDAEVNGVDVQAEPEKEEDEPENEEEEDMGSGDWDEMANDVMAFDFEAVEPEKKEGEIENDESDKPSEDLDRGDRAEDEAHGEPEPEPAPEPAFRSLTDVLLIDYDDEFASTSSEKSEKEGDEANAGEFDNDSEDFERGDQAADANLEPAPEPEPAPVTLADVLLGDIGDEFDDSDQESVISEEE